MTASGTPEAPAPVAGRGPDWPPDALALAQQLQRCLSIHERDWHRLKGQRSRRAAEQLAGALVRLLAGDDPKLGAATPARREAIELVDHALGWLRSEISDPGCPAHGR
ncbi:MAG: DUF6439 family protein [Cyanobacteriota bacterium]|jgi:hypothetical protein